MLAAGAPRELMQSPFCRASVANRCSFESACLRKLFIWMLQPRASMCANGLAVRRAFVPRIVERRQYQRQTRQPMPQYVDAIGFTCRHECGNPVIRVASFQLGRFRAYLHLLHFWLWCF